MRRYATRCSTIISQPLKRLAKFSRHYVTRSALRSDAFRVAIPPINPQNHLRERGLVTDT
jgi:hypothetical protein